MFIRKTNIKFMIMIFFIIIYCFIPLIQKSIGKSEYSICNISINQYSHTYNSKFFSSTIDEMIKQIDAPFSFEKCHFCNKTHARNNSKGDSTDKDLIIIQGGGAISRTMLSILSLRTAGCKARIFLVIEQNDKIRKNESEVFKDCGIFVFRANEIRNTTLNMQRIRYVLISEFCEAVNRYIDRILYFDAFDSLIQGDPFNFKWEKNVLYVSNEHHQIKDNKFLKETISNITGFSYKVIGNKTIYCSGVFGGDSETMMRVGQTTQTMYRGKELVSKDQAMYNYLIHMGIFEKAGIRIETNPDFVSMGHFPESLSGMGFGDIHDDQNFYPAIVHQINRNRTLFKKVLTDCCVNDRNY